MGGFLPGVAVSRDPFARHKSDALKAAQDLGYGDDTVARVRKAKTSAEINQIMKAARARRFGD